MATADTNLIISVINARIDQTISTLLNATYSTTNQLVGVINTGHNILLQNITAQLNNVNAQIQNRLNSITSQIISYQQALTSNVIAVIQQVNTQQTALEQNLNSQLFSQIQGLVSNSNGINTELNNRIISQIKGVNEQSIGIIKDTGSQVIAKLQDSISQASIGSGGINQDTLLNGDFLNNLLTEVFNILFDIDVSRTQTHSGILEDAFQPLIDSVHDQSGKIDKVIQDITTGKYTDLNTALDAFFNVGIDHTLTDIVIFVSNLITAVPKLTSIKTAPFYARLEQLARTQYGLTLVDASTLTNLYQRQWITYNEYHDGLRKLGYSEDNSQILISGSHPSPSFDSLRLLYYRGGLTRQQAIDSANKLPASLEDKRAFEHSLDQIPPIQDIITMAVREAFSPDIATAFGQYEDYPNDLTQWANKQGYSVEWARRYWAAHWNLPSSIQGFEMLHRGVIDQTTLNRLLKALDVMPFWRDKLTQIAYNVPTRVDIRRMYAEGIINYNEVYRSYLDLGYNSVWAKRLADYAVRYDEEQSARTAGHINDLTSSTVESAYKRKIITRQEATQRLNQLKYNIQDINLLLSLWDYQEYIRLHPDRVADEYNNLANITLAAYKRKVLDTSEAISYLTQSGYSTQAAQNALKIADLENAVSRKADYVNAIEKQYLDGIIDINTARGYLTGLNFSVNEVEDILQNFTVLRNLSKGRPTKAELISMAKKGIITTDDLRDELTLMNYSEYWIEPLIELAGLGEE